MMQLVIISLALGLIPPFILFFNNIENNKIVGIYPFLYLVFIASLYELIFSLYYKVNVNNWFIVYDILSFGSIHYFFFKLLDGIKNWIFIYTTLIFLILLFFLHFVSLSWFDSSFLIKNSIFSIFQSLTILCFSILWFLKIFNELEVENLFRSPIFYFTAGLNIYFGGTVLLFLVSHYFQENDPNSLEDFWILNIVLNIFLRILLIVGIWKARVK
jgi:hypothetical protein